jgi:nucleotide-binding universal stress UspA family protein
MLARSSGDDIVVCTTLPIPWVPGVARDDPRFRTYAQELADTALAHAREDMPDDVSVRFTTINAKSAPTGLLEAAEQCEASMIVVGSAMGLVERVTVSSVADRLLHSSPIPVAVSPRGFRAGEHRVKRVTLGVTGGPQSRMLITAAQALADQFGADLRLASLAVHLSPPETARFRAEGNAVIAEWAEAILSATMKDVQPDEADRQAPEIVVGYGDDWDDALDDIDWEPGDLLIIGSSDSAPTARVFLGSRATQILRHTTVPVITVPRGPSSS